MNEQCLDWRQRGPGIIHLFYETDAEAARQAEIHGLTLYNIIYMRDGSWMLKFATQDN